MIVAPGPLHLIIGAAGGIGAAPSRQLADAGARLVPAAAWITGQVIGVDGVIGTVRAR